MLCLLDAVLAVVHAVVHAVVDAIAYPVLSAYMLFLCSVRMARKSDGPERHVARQHVARQHVACHVARQSVWLSHSHESEQEGYWYYFNNRDEPKPEAAFYLPGYRVEVSVDPATGVMTTCLHAKNKGWLSVSGPTKVFPPLPLCHAICHLLPPPLAAPAPSFLHPLQLPSAHELRITHVDAWLGGGEAGGSAGGCDRSLCVQRARALRVEDCPSVLCRP
jgi:hypothetical protein